MKSIMFKTILVLAIVFSCSIAQANDNKAPMSCGPVASISTDYQSLSPEVKAFLDDYFHYSKIVEVEKETFNGVYEIDFSDGYKLEITESGQWTEIEAPDNATLPQALLKKLIPKKSFDYLVSKNLQNSVEEISFNFERGFKPDLDNHNDILFTKSGKLK